MVWPFRQTWNVMYTSHLWRLIVTGRVHKIKFIMNRIYVNFSCSQLLIESISLCFLKKCRLRFCSHLSFRKHFSHSNHFSQRKHLRINSSSFWSCEKSRKWRGLGTTFSTIFIEKAYSSLTISITRNVDWTHRYREGVEKVVCLEPCHFTDE